MAYSGRALRTSTGHAHALRRARAPLAHPRASARVLLGRAPGGGATEAEGAAALAAVGAAASSGKEAEEAEEADGAEETDGEEEADGAERERDFEEF